MSVYEQGIYQMAYEYSTWTHGDCSVGLNLIQVFPQTLILKDSQPFLETAVNPGMRLARFPIRKSSDTPKSAHLQPQHGSPKDHSPNMTPTTMNLQTSGIKKTSEHPLWMTGIHSFRSSRALLPNHKPLRP